MGDPFRGALFSSYHFERDLNIQDCFEVVVSNSSEIEVFCVTIRNAVRESGSLM